MEAKRGRKVGDISKATLDRLTQMESIHAERGDINIPKDWEADPSLYTWIGTVRQRFVRGTLSPVVIARLSAIGFDFAPRLRGTTEEVEDRLECLHKFRKETGRVLPTKHDKCKEYAALAQWIARMRRYNAGGNLSTEIAARLSKAGVSLALNADKNRSSASEKLENSAFNRNLLVLSNWLEKRDADGQERNIRYVDCRQSKEASVAYRFIEHLVLKARQGVLSDEHKSRISLLDFRVNGKPINVVLNPDPSMASVEGYAVTRAQSVAKKAEEEAAIATERATKARRDAEEARLRAEEASRNMVSNMQAAAKVVAIGKAEVLANAETYLTTDELAEKIKYDSRTIRETMVDKVFVEGIHFLRPFGGRKLLFIWSRIERDMHTGAFSGGTYGGDQAADSC